MQVGLGPHEGDRLPRNKLPQSWDNAWWKFEPLYSESDYLAERKAREAAEAENNTLRALLGNSAKPCTYCGLPAEDQGKCQYGFPGCMRADDQQLSKHFADGWAAEHYTKENVALRARAEAAEADARRYRWLRDNNSSLPAFRAPDELDAAIDAAMQEAKR